MADKNDDMKARMLAALEAKKISRAHQVLKTILKPDQRFAAGNAAVALHRYSAKQVLQDQVLLARHLLCNFSRS